MKQQLTALELEKAKEEKLALQKELESRRTIFERYMSHYDMRLSESGPLTPGLFFFHNWGRGYHSARSRNSLNTYYLCHSQVWLPSKARL
jgi:hypothetical protein